MRFEIGGSGQKKAPGPPRWRSGRANQREKRLSRLLWIEDVRVFAGAEELGAEDVDGLTVVAFSDEEVGAEVVSGCGAVDAADDGLFAFEDATAFIFVAGPLTGSAVGEAVGEEWETTVGGVVETADVGEGVFTRLEGLGEVRGLALVVVGAHARRGFVVRVVGDEELHFVSAVAAHEELAEGLVGGAALRELAVVGAFEGEGTDPLVDVAGLGGGLFGADARHDGTEAGVGAGCEHGDDGDDDEEFDQGEAPGHGFLFHG